MRPPVAVAILGGGAWGSVLAAVAARHGHDVVLWEIDGAAADALVRDRVSPRSVAGFRLPAEVAVSTDIGHAVTDRDILVVAVPSQYVAATLQAAAPPNCRCQSVQYLQSAWNPVRFFRAWAGCLPA
jgi:glycerol-3-phosphate dehydrogenase (NAD(P)+)